jgi:acetyltransferase
MEGLNEGAKFLSLASEVTKEKPVILLKTAGTETSMKSAMSHTGTMAGNFQVHRAALNHAGVIFLEKDGQMKYAVKTLSNMPALEGDNIAVITFSGAAGIMVTDALEKYGLKLSTLCHNTINKIAELSPDWMPLGNPLDIWPAVMKHGAAKAYSTALETVLSDSQVDGVVCIAIAPALPDFSFLDVSGSLNMVMKKPFNKPVVAWLYGPNTEEISKKFESENKIMTYPTLETAAWSLSILRSSY